MSPPTPRSTRPAGSCGCPPSGTGTARPPPPRPASRPATRGSWSSCCPWNAMTGKPRARPGWAPRPPPPASTGPKRVGHCGGAATPTGPAALIASLAKSTWVAAGQPCCLIGDSGTGKSHLLIGLGTAAAENGYRVKYTTAAALVNELVEAADDKTLSRTIARYGRVGLLCLDELGYLELDRRGAELLFQVFTEREERASIAIASNAAFSEWTATFTDPRLCAAIVDRLTFDAHIINTGTDSYRLRAAKARQAARTG